MMPTAWAARLKLFVPLLGLLLGVILACDEQQRAEPRSPSVVPSSSVEQPSPIPMPLLLPQDSHVSPPQTGPVGPLEEDGLYILDLVTGELTLTHPHGHAPAWSPDGERLAFGVYLADEPSRWDELGCWGGAPAYCGLAIQIVDLESGEEPKEVALGEAPSWDHTGDRLLFSKLIWKANDGRGRGEIHLLDVKSGEDVVLSTHEPFVVQRGNVFTSIGELDKSPKWSYDESSIVYSYVGDIYQVPTDASGPPELVTSGYVAAASPASPFIAVSRFDGRNSDIFVLPLDDPEQETFVAVAPSVSWSPDGRFLAYYPGQSPGGQPATGIRHVDSGQVHALDGGGYSIDLWSPDGSMFAYDAVREAASPDTPPSSEIFLTSGDGSAQPVRLADGQPLAWLPDGSGLVALRRVSGTDQTGPSGEGLALVGLDGSTYSLVTSVPDCTSISVSPDGSKLAISAHHCRV